MPPYRYLFWEAVHPIRRHYTPSDRVHRDVTGVSRRNGCTVARSGSVDGLLIGLGGAHCRAWACCSVVLHHLEGCYTSSEVV